jgi:thymidylate synthase
MKQKNINNINNMNNIDKQYTVLLQDILDNGVEKGDRTGTGTKSLFGRQIRHKMSEGFPLLTTKKLHFKSIVTELLWFLRGDTNIKYLVDNDCHIWDGDAYKNYWFNWRPMLEDCGEDLTPYTQEEFINKIKTDDEFAKKWGELGPIYGKQWRKWKRYRKIEDVEHKETLHIVDYIDQITNLINDLKVNPDSRRLMVNAWNVGKLHEMVLPPCHYGFQVYTRELSNEEVAFEANKRGFNLKGMTVMGKLLIDPKEVKEYNLPTRAISLMWNQRSVDTFLGLPFNIASYGLLLEIIAKAVNMVPDELIGNLGDVHLYSNHIEQAKEQIGRDLTYDERTELLKKAMGIENYKNAIKELMPFGGGMSEYYEAYKIPYRTREPYPLPTLNINTEFWPYEGGECGEGPLDAVAVFNSFKKDDFCKCLLEEDIQLGNYQSHPTIKATLSN